MDWVRKKKKQNHHAAVVELARLTQWKRQKTGMGVKILGGGCAKCNQLETATAEALTELGMDTTIEHIKDWGEIASYGVMTTPALVIDGKVVSFGKVLKKDEVVKILKEVRG